MSLQPVRVEAFTTENVGLVMVAVTLTILHTLVRQCLHISLAHSRVLNQPLCSQAALLSRYMFSICSWVVTVWCIYSLDVYPITMG